MHTCRGRWEWRPLGLPPYPRLCTHNKGLSQVLASPRMSEGQRGGTPGPKKCTVNVKSSIFIHLYNLICRIDVLTNSSPIDRAPGAHSKSVEFVETSILVFKIASILCEITSRLCCTFWDPESRAGSHVHCHAVEDMCGLWRTHQTTGWLTWGPESAIRIILTQQSPPYLCRSWTIHPNAKKKPPQTPADKRREPLGVLVCLFYGYLYRLLQQVDMSIRPVSSVG